jgi:hypothetical protein
MTRSTYTPVSQLSFSEAPESKSWLKKKLLPVLKPVLNIAATVFPVLTPVAVAANVLIK